jgi:hypothetical protein
MRRGARSALPAARTPSWSTTPLRLRTRREHWPHFRFAFEFRPVRPVQFHEPLGDPKRIGLRGCLQDGPAADEGHATALIAGVCQTRSRCPKSVELKDSNHLSEGMAVGTPDQQLTGPLLQWIKALPAKRQ